jgi:hypothetical protein
VARKRVNAGRLDTYLGDHGWRLRTLQSGDATGTMCAYQPWGNRGGGGTVFPPPSLGVWNCAKPSGC